MTVLPIRISGDPALHTPAKNVEVFNHDLASLVRDMIETMHAAPGVGLAATQIGIQKRIFVYEWTDEEDITHSGIAINPTLWIEPLRIEPIDSEQEQEGCLSFPGERFALRRSDRALLHAYDLEGNFFEIHAQGWLARIFQHEYDHLDGILYIDRLSKKHVKTLNKIHQKNGWGVPGQQWIPGKEHLEP